MIGIYIYMRLICWFSEIVLAVIDQLNSASRCIDDDQMALCFSCQSPFQGEINQCKDSLYDLAPGFDGELRICGSFNEATIAT